MTKPQPGDSRCTGKFKPGEEVLVINDGGQGGCFHWLKVGEPARIIEAADGEWYRVEQGESFQWMAENSIEAMWTAPTDEEIAEALRSIEEVMK